MSRRIFVTGATGYIGSAVAARLVRQGHQVFGLTRNADNARSLAAAGMTPVVGDLAELDEWQGVLQNCDAAVHTAFEGENGAADVDQAALDAMRYAALDGRVRRVLYTSNVWVHGHGAEGLADETTPLAPLAAVQWRAAHEEIALDLGAHEVDVVILRPGLGDGAQRGARADAYALALEHAPGGERYLLADESRHTVKELAEAVAAATGSKAVSWPAAELVRAHGGFGEALLNDLIVSSARARRELGWVPRHTSFAAEAEPNPT